MAATQPRTLSDFDRPEPLQTPATPAKPKRPTIEQCLVQAVDNFPGQLERGTPDAKGRPTLTLILTESIELEGSPVSRLTLHKPTAFDMEKSDAVDGAIASSRLVLASCARVPAKLLEALPLEDFVAGQAAIDALSGKALSRLSAG